MDSLTCLQVVSPRNHMVFTPLLASACVGTIEPRGTAVPLVEIQKGLKQPHNFYFNAKATAVNTDARTVECVDETGIRFSCSYDCLAVATGSQVLSSSQYQPSHTCSGSMPSVWRFNDSVLPVLMAGSPNTGVCMHAWPDSIVADVFMFSWHLLA